ncbi:hypothetical protein IE81DRAFT_349212 [Ceraceosorus guamensis]|uniref:UTP23 sensor motif region domain-containing protein n=1 Tax=Ceraceosorus guamensis TaxID=1522189 RepID=A0A316VTC3_9BASI|nr:hypothetical protein IE81DRAFT_349212 [Ceraceosorus guamensis]PWN40474.1 hypothetical protein IE81DRAFT_349212 [Ceraceosorus guamensis]
MRQKRAKQTRKCLSLYLRHFNFRLPLQLLLDSDLILALAKQNISAEALPLRLADALQVHAVAALGSKARVKAKLAQAQAHGQQADSGSSHSSSSRSTAAPSQVKLLISQCCIEELYKLDKDEALHRRAVKLAKSCERRLCGHKEVHLSSQDCIKSCIGATNKHRYVLCSNSFALRQYVRQQIAGVPCLHTNPTGVLVMEPTSTQTMHRVRQLEACKLSTDAHEASLLGAAAQSHSGTSSPHIISSSSIHQPGASSADADAGASGSGNSRPSSDSNHLLSASSDMKKRKKAKEPNPLSVKKRKVRLIDGDGPKRLAAAHGSTTSQKEESSSKAADAKRMQSLASGRSGAARRKRRKRGAGGAMMADAPATEGQGSD